MQVVEDQRRSGVVGYNFRAMDTYSDFAQIVAALGREVATATREALDMSVPALEDGVA